MKINRKQRFALIAIIFFAGVVLLLALWPRNLIITGQINNQRTEGERVDLRLLVFDNEIGGAIIEKIDYDDVPLTRDGRYDLVYPTSLFSLPSQSYLQVCVRVGVSTELVEGDLPICEEGATAAQPTSSTSVLGSSTEDRSYTNVSCTRQRVVSQVPGLLTRLFNLQPQQYEFLNLCEEVYTQEEFTTVVQQEIITREILTETGGGGALQLLTIEGNKISISGGNFIELPSPEDIIAQSLVVVGDQLTISEGNTVTLPASGDDQALILSGVDLGIEDGTSVNLSPFLDNTDTQDLSLASNTLSLVDGGSVDLSAYLDNIDTTYTNGAGLNLVANYILDQLTNLCGYG